MNTNPLEIGQRVCYQTGENSPITHGVILWMGTLPGGEGLGVLAGVQTDQAVGRNGNGKYKGIQYFLAKEGHAAFVPLYLLRAEKDIIIINNRYQDGNSGTGVIYNQDTGRSFGAIGTPVPPSQDFRPPQYHPQPAQHAFHQVQNVQPEQPHPHSSNEAEIEEEVEGEEEVEDEEELEEEEYFESDDDMDEKLSVDTSEMDRRLNHLLLQKNAIITDVTEKDARSARSTNSASPTVVEVDAAGIPIKESSDQWSKVAEKLKKAPSKVQEKLATEKAPVIAPKKKEKSAVYNEELAKSNPKYKKTLCHFFEREGKCYHGDRCFFAHGAHELRVAVLPKFPLKKNTLCQFHMAGGCKHGDKCTFAHGERELNNRRF